MSSEKAQKVRKTLGGCICCVVGSNSRSTVNRGLSFHKFPFKLWERDRRKKWIESVHRMTEDGKPWEPNKNSRICALHFVGGKKSEDPRKEAYNPTVFPEIYGKRRFSIGSRDKRHHAQDGKQKNASNALMEVTGQQSTKDSSMCSTSNFTDQNLQSNDIINPTDLLSQTSQSEEDKDCLNRVSMWCDLLKSQLISFDNQTRKSLMDQIDSLILSAKVKQEIVTKDEEGYYMTENSAFTSDLQQPVEPLFVDVQSTSFNRSVPEVKEEQLDIKLEDVGF